ncbi:OmpL47-type beta-barrel domain-containing protein [Paenibacillus wynnii]|uniref:Uncharacterized protein n=1 Tax=Paenibacillus wynnii TaxID=268407 RepID=A0A098M4D5_9BACL|nr:hypothetical protein [Paenibacillus wynnii]KGE17414.1 hypothetical protein PWYN_22670 [Paenibacillus wynnii]
MRKWMVTKLVLVFFLMISFLTYLPVSLVHADYPYDTPLPLQGTLTDEYGNPMKGIELSVVSPRILGYSGGYKDLGSAITDENGHFSMEPFSRYFIDDTSYYSAYITFTVKGYPVIRYLGMGTTFSFQFPKLLNHVEGTVTIEGTNFPNPGLPVVAGMRMTKRDLYELSSTITDEHGHYAMDYIPADFKTYDEEGRVIVTSQETKNDRTYDYKTAFPVAPTTIYGYLQLINGDSIDGTIQIDGISQYVGTSGFVINLGDSNKHHVKFTSEGFVPYETELGSGGPYYIQLDFKSFPPNVQAISDRAPDRNGWYNRNVTVSFEASDNNWYQELKVDLPKVITSEGENQVITGSATDEEGLTGYGSIIINLDKTTPITTAIITPATSTNWLNSATMVLSPKDSLSGVSETEYSLDGGQTWKLYTSPTTFVADGHYSVLYRSIDKAGNSEAIKMLTFNLDGTAPTIHMAEPIEGRYRSVGNLVPNFTIEDLVSGVNLTKTLITVDGQKAQNGVPIPLYMLPLGTHSFKIKTADIAGNEATFEVEFVTYSDMDSLRALVQRFTDEGKITSSVANTLQKKLEQNQLKPFISLIEAHRGKAIDNKAAGFLLRDVKALQ